MQRRYQHTTDGQEVTQDDLNLLASAALAEDRVLAEMLRVLPYSSGAARGILRPGFHVGGGVGQYDEVVVPGGSAATVRVNPFRAVVGSRSDTSDDAWLTDVRSGVFVGSDTEAPAEDLTIDPTVANHRWDLVYARVDVDLDATSESRYVKDVTGAVTEESISVAKITQVSVAVVKGTEAVTPAKPSLPSDGGSAYYIPLAYVLVEHPFTGASVVAPDTICVVAPVLQLSDAVGGCPVAPANKAHENGASFGVDWTQAGGRPGTYLPPTMAGSVERLIPMQFGAGGIPLGATTTIDDSIDWRNRIFHIVGATALSSAEWAWRGQDEDFPQVTDVSYSAIGGSFNAEWTPSGEDFPAIASLNSSFGGLAASSGVDLLVDQATGALQVRVKSTDPARKVLLWVKASGQFANA